jgi:hypothetical protein
MAWQLLGRPKTQRATKALAKQFVEMDAAPHDRELSEKRLQVYQRFLAAGQFRPVTWATALCRETGGLYRVNGKHTSTLLSGLEEMPEFYVTVEEYECDTLEDVAKLYATFDSNLQSRTARDIYMSFAATVPEIKGLPARTIGVAVAGMSIGLGIAVLGRSSWMVRQQPADRAELLLEHPEFVLWLHELIGTGKPNSEKRSARHLMRAPVVGAAFNTWKKAKGPATDFWTAVRDETGTPPAVPDRKLAHYLLTVGVDSGRGASRVRKSDPREMYVKCLHAWNAWRSGESTSLHYYAEAKVPAIH